MKRLNHRELFDYFFHIVSFAAVFMVIGYYVPKIYLTYFDRRTFYNITNPVTVEKKINIKCEFIDAYIHRKVLAPMKGTSVKQLTLIRDNGMKERIRSFTTDIQADVGEATMIAHWQLPCDIQSGTYFFEGTVEYKVFDITRYTHFYTENFMVIATGEAVLDSP